MEDHAIIDLFFARDESAILETERKYGAYLNQVVYGILRSPQDTEEIVSDTYYGAWEAIPPAVPKVLKHFLARIARNLCFKRLEYQNAAKRAHAQTALDELEECIPDAAHATERLWEAGELARLLNAFLDGLSDLECAVFVSRYFYCRTLAEVGERYGISERRAKYLLSRLRAGLRALLEKEGIAP